MEHTPPKRRLPLCVALMTALLPALLAAQEISRTRAVTTVNRACSQLASSPSLLGQSPEGRALLRFNRELGGAAEVIELRGDANRWLDIRRVAEMQRGVDSLMQIVVTYRRPDGSDAETVTIRRGDSLPRMVYGKPLSPSPAMWEEMEVRLRTTFPNATMPGTDTLSRRSHTAVVEAAIRSLQPRIAAFSGSPNARFSMRTVAPTGYLGVHLLESKITMASAAGAITNYCDYPVIEAIDPDSPAARAGLSAGDTVLAYNGRDVQKIPVNYSELVVPGQVLRVRVKRAGKTRESAITVGARKDERNTFVMRAPCPAGATCTSSSLSFNTDGRDTVRVRRVAAGAVVPGRMPMPQGNVSALPPAAFESMFSGGSIAIIAGAQLSALDGELAQSLGVEPGILVMLVPAGSPAADAGLRVGDVIRTVNGTPVRDLLLLGRAYNTPGAREIKLTVSTRNIGTRTVLLRAPERE